MPIDLSTPNEWQHRDEALGLVMPWYTKPFLDELRGWDLLGKRVFEFGCGASTLWYGARGAHVVSVESSANWQVAVMAHHMFKYMECKVLLRQDRVPYTYLINQTGVKYDVVVVDGDPVEWRDECVWNAVECLVPYGILIIDNWQQESVWMPNEQTTRLLQRYKSKTYAQPGHGDWKTAYWVIEP